MGTGIPGSAADLAAAFAELGFRRADLRRIVLTHCHVDHAGSADDVGGWGDVEVLVHRLDAPVIRASDAARNLCSPTRRCRGHTDGSVAIRLPAHGVLFTGDLIANSAARRRLTAKAGVDARAAQKSKHACLLSPWVPCHAAGVAQTQGGGHDRS